MCGITVSRVTSRSLERFGWFACVCTKFLSYKTRVRSFAMIWIRISDLRSLGSWPIKWTDESTLEQDSSVLLMYYDPSDLQSLAWSGSNQMNVPYMSTLYRISFNAEMKSCTVVRFSMNDNSTELSQVVQKYQTFHHCYNHCTGAFIRNIYFRLSV